MIAIMFISSVADCYISNYVDYAVFNDTFLDKVLLRYKQQCLIYNHDKVING